VRGEYEGAELGDRRLNARLQTIAEALEAKPDAGFPNAMTEAELEAFYRFLSNDRVDADRVLAPHVEATVGRCAGRDTVLCVQDTTVFKFGTPREGLGEYAGQTLFGHIVMAVGLDGVALGVVGLSPWARGNDTVRQRRLRGEKIPHGADGWPNEQDRWMSTVAQTEEVFEDGPSLIHVMDSEADDYTILRKLVSGPHRFIIRAGGNRRLQVQDDGPNKLREFVSSSPIVCTREVHLSKRAKTRFRVNTKQKLPRQSRQATLSIGAGAVQLRAPQYYRKKVAHPLALNVVWVREVDVGDGIEPGEWTLMTTEPIDTEEQILAVVDSYRHRWKIEELFKALKTKLSDARERACATAADCMEPAAAQDHRAARRRRTGRDCAVVGRARRVAPCRREAATQTSHRTPSHAGHRQARRSPQTQRRTRMDGAWPWLSQAPRSLPRLSHRQKM